MKNSLPLKPKLLFSSSRPKLNQKKTLVPKRRGHIKLTLEFDNPRCSPRAIAPFQIQQFLIYSPIGSNPFEGICINNYHISHLVHADGHIILGKASFANLEGLKDKLSYLFEALGFTLNIDKSLIYFSKRTLAAVALQNPLGINRKDSKFTYLGLPVSLKNLHAPDFQKLQHKLKKILNGWKTKILSFAGIL